MSFINKLYKSYKLALKYGSPHAVLISASFFALLAAALFEGVGISILLPVLQSLNEVESDSKIVLKIKEIFSYAGINYDFINLIVVFSVLILIKYVLLIFQQRVTRVLANTSTCDLRKRSINALHTVSLDYFHKNKMGDIISTTLMSTSQAGGYWEYLLTLVKSIIFVVVYGVAASLISIEFTMLVLACALLAYIFVFPRFKIGEKLGKESKKWLDMLHSILHDQLSGIKLIKSFGTEKRHIDEFSVNAEKAKLIGIKVMDNKLISYAFFEPFLFVLLISMFIFSIKNLGLELSSILVMLLIFMQIIPHFKSINNNILVLTEIIPHFERVNEIMTLEPYGQPTEGQVDINKINSSVELKNVSFRYKDSSANAIENISMSLTPGKITAIVGSSGSGKTTLVDIIQRYYRPFGGEILLDGVNIDKYTIDSWRKMIGFVDQECFLFHKSVYDNISYSDENVSKEAVFKAANLSHSNQFIDELDSKYSTIVGYRGSNLSGGQKQRISIARAILKEPQILILDEATSALDSETEKDVQETIFGLRDNRIIIIIAHRLSTIKMADNIIVMDKGKIIEQGDHEHLNAINGRYSELLRHQYFNE